MKRLSVPSLAAGTEKKKQQLSFWKRLFLLSLILTVFFSLVMVITASAAGVDITINTEDTTGNLGVLEVFFVLAFMSLLPSIVMMMTSFTRIIIVLSFLRSALGTNQSPPNMVLTGIAFFLSLYIMAPTIGQMNETAYQPYTRGEMTSTQALTAAILPVKKFMLTQASPSSLRMFLDLSDTPYESVEVKDPENPVELMDLPITVVTPAFITSEISRAFQMGFLIFLPFLVIDLVVSSILMSMGMVMLPPAMIALPFKILLFVMVNGWDLMMKTLVVSFKS